MTKQETDRRIHAAIFALAALERDDGIDCGVATVRIHGIEDAVDIVADITGAKCKWTHASNGRERYRVADVTLSGVDLTAFGKHEMIPVAETEPAPPSANMLAGGTLSDTKGAA